MESGEEIVLGYSTSLFRYLLNNRKEIIVPIHGNRNYTIVKNIYNDMCDQFVTYKSVAHE